MYTSPLRVGRLGKEVAKVFIQPYRDARAFPNRRVHEDSLRFMKDFRGYAEKKLRDWKARGVLHLRPCPLCGSGTSRARIRTPECIEYMSCEGCGFVFLNPAPSQVAYNEIYETSYDGLLSEWEKKKDENGCSDYLEESYFSLDILRRYQPSGRFLDYGCGSGWILRLAKAYYDVTGMDINPVQLARIREVLGIHSLVEGDITEGLPATMHGCFDVVHSNQNLEHMLEPRKCIVEWRKALRSGGYLFIACPNVDSFAFEIFGGQNSMAILSHVSLFSLKTLRSLLVREGFDVVESGSYCRDVGSFEYWVYRVNPAPAAFEHRHAWPRHPKSALTLGYPVWIVTELYFYFEMLRRRETFGNYLYVLARRR
jgi:SAM-dependent methyltransferase